MRLGSSGTASALAVLALVIAVGTGGAYAAGLIGPNDIAKNAVRSKHVKADQIAPKHLGAMTAVTNVAEASSETNCDGPDDPIAEFCGLGPGALWTNYQQGFQPVGFYKDGSGLVHLQGGARADSPHEASVHKDIFHLPAGYRPGTVRRFPVTYNAGQTTFIQVHPDGTVETWTGPPIDYISLDGIYFRP